MSYCVNCGVELDASAGKCPLCQTRVINPNEEAQDKKDKEQFSPYSTKEHIPPSANRSFIAYIISMVILIPNIVCTFVNLLFRDGGYWAPFVNATSFLVWVVFVFPFFTKKLKPYLMWAFDTVAAAAYVFFFFAVTHASGKNWYFTCALPIILIISVMVLADIVWIRKKKRHWVLKSIVILSDIAVACIVSGALVDYATTLDFMFEIGAIVFVSCAALVAFLIYCYTSKHMRRWLSKRFFV